MLSHPSSTLGQLKRPHCHSSVIRVVNNCYQLQFLGVRSFRMPHNDNNLYSNHKMNVMAVWETFFQKHLLADLLDYVHCRESNDSFFMMYLKR